MNKEFNKIVLVCLDFEYCISIGKLLSENLDMIFCDAKELLEYELIDSDAIKKFCSKEYLALSEKKVFKKMASFENVVIGINYDYLVHNYEVLEKESLIVFINLPKNHFKDDTVNLLAFENRTQTLEKLATLTINVKKTEKTFVYNKIIKAIGGIL